MSEQTITKQKNLRPKPVVLCVLDGFGIAPPYAGNAVSLAKMPNFNELVTCYPTFALSASGEAVGLPWGEMGNSEVGHLNLGAGRIVYQDLPRINKSISDNTFFSNPALLGAVEQVKKNKSSLHIMGLLSTGGVHAAVEHLLAILALTAEQKLPSVYIHLFLDGRDMAYNSGRQLVADLLKSIAEYKVGRIATISGRFYAMDRDNNWERVAPAYTAIVYGRSERTFADPLEAVDFYYSQKIYDEEFKPTVITGRDGLAAAVNDNDAVIFFNFRADRARQLTKAIILPGFNKIKDRKKIQNLYFATLTEYEKNLPVKIAFPPEVITNTLGDVIAASGLKQLRLAETEKYAHVTYFFNGGKEEPRPKEERIIVPSVRTESYADKPKMSAPEITAALNQAIHQDEYDFILMNYANADMVGHTGNIDATVEALEYLDKALGEVSKLVLAQKGVLLITADHGNAEELFNMQTGSIDKEHSTNPVPLVIISYDYEGKNLGGGEAGSVDLSLLKPQGILADVAPTVLKIMRLPKPKEMTGRSLI